MDPDKAFTGSIPALYNKYLGPLIFEPYAADLSRRVSALSPSRILETAAGTGVVTKVLDQAQPHNVHIIASDLNQPMLDFAAQHVPSTRILWQQADALALPFGDGAFDVVVCQFGAMFFPDKVKGYSEAFRVLKPGGRFLFNVWDRLEKNEFTNIASQAIAAFFPDNPPTFMSRTPHSYCDSARISGELKQAGFQDISFETVAKESKAPSAREPAIGLCQGTPLRNEIEARDASRLDEVTRAAQAALEARFGSGPDCWRAERHRLHRDKMSAGAASCRRRHPRAKFAFQSIRRQIVGNSGRSVT
ncbi:class I SAM-dependent methyltransferase [Terrarubrum flagellatum]|uniref:class I SAM-dependent methyltransferase n=1 Tax=Terrirubrum flagellatum TaxID=2895980 RepID=UPI0031453111